MNFDALANHVSSLYTLNEEVEAANPEFNSWYAAQDPADLTRFSDKNKAYRYWRAKHRGQSPDAAPVSKALTPKAPQGEMPKMADAVPTAADLAPAGISLDSPGARKTQVAIDDYKIQNPEATTEDIVAHLQSLNDDNTDRRFEYVTDPAAVEQMAKSEDSILDPADTEVDSGVKDIQQSKIERLRNFMRMNKAERDKYLHKADPVIPDEDEEEEPEEDDTDPDVAEYLKGMKDLERDEEV